MHPILLNSAFVCISRHIAFIVISFLSSVVPALGVFIFLISPVLSFLPRHSKFYVMTRSVGAFPSAPDTSEQSDAHLYPKAPASSDTTPVDESNIFLLLLLFLF